MTADPGQAANLGVASVRHYFAYGSNMNPARVQERGLVVLGLCGARLLGKRLVFDKVSRLHPEAAHANIVHAPGRVVEGVLYRLVGADEILKMDPFERAPWNYGRDVVQVVVRGEAVWAWTYFANDAVRRSGLHPPAAYLAHMLAGKAHLSPGYYQRLSQTPTATGG